MNNTVWLVVATIGGLCVLASCEQDINDTSTVDRRRPVHIHQHNGDTTSQNSTDIIREESKYFLKKLFVEYGSGERMDLTGLEKILDHLGYYSGENGGQEHKHGDTVHDADDELAHDEHEHGKLHEQVNDTDYNEQAQNVYNEDSAGRDDDEQYEHDKQGHHNVSELTTDEHIDHDHNERDDLGHTEQTVESEQGDHNNTDEDKFIDTNGKVGGHKAVDNEHGDLEELGEHNHTRHGEHQDNDQSGDTKTELYVKKRQKSRSKGKKNRRQKQKSGRSSKLKKKRGRRDKRSALSVIYHAHEAHSDCLSVQQLLEIFHFDEKRKISQRDFLHLSPAIIYQLDKPQCRRQKTSAHGDERKVEKEGISGRVWGYSLAAVLVISLVGLLGVAVIPIMQKLFYNQLLQFLVAMAVGALTGDAMLHLLPHAIAGEVTVEEGGTDHDHSNTIWKGLSGLAGIYFFFLLQRLLTIVTGVRNKRRKKMLEKQTYEVEVAAKSPRKEDSDDELEEINIKDQKSEQLKPLRSESDGKEVKHHHRNTHSHGGHGHSHHDGTMPSSVSAVAWMVILGDGVHNLSDGLAIGAAFASSITGGLSTSIAVFCHELPHEIGDFAVLLKAGMSVKQAVLYNCLSSLLCLLGMLAGVALGNIEEASTWIFAAVGGMFIYISLVTMVPELTSVDSQKPVRDLILQCSGICVGSGIMLAIAIYEKDLLTMLG